MKKKYEPIGTIKKPRAIKGYATDKGVVLRINKHIKADKQKNKKPTIVYIFIVDIKKSCKFVVFIFNDANLKRNWPHDKSSA